VSDGTMEILLQDITSEAREDKTRLLLQLVEQCLLQLGSSKENIGNILDTKLCDILLQVTKNVEDQWTQVDILSKLSDKLNTLLTQLRKTPSYPFENAFTQKMNIIEFNEKLSDFMSKVERKTVAMKTTPVLYPKSTPELKESTNCPAKVVQETTVKDTSQGLDKTIACLVSCISHVITIEWKSLFTWQLNDLVVIEDIKDKTHDVLFSLFTACKSLQTLMMDKDFASCNQLQDLTNVLEPYFQQHATTEEMSCIKDISSGQNVRKERNGDIDGKMMFLC
jgi:hypothetical protein